MINRTTLDSPITRAATLSTNSLSNARSIAPAPVTTPTAAARPLAAPLSPVADAFARPTVSPLKLSDPAVKSPLNDAGVQSLLSAFSPKALDVAQQADLASTLNEEPAAETSFAAPEPSFASPEAANSIAQELQTVKELLRQALAINNLGDELGLPDWANQGSGGGTREILPPPGVDGGW